MHIKGKRLLLSSLLIAVSSQFYMDILFSDFRVTGAVIVLGITLFLYRKINPIYLGIIVAGSTFLWRTGIFLINHSFDRVIIGGYVPEIFFYILYGVIFTFFMRKNPEYNANKFFFIILFSDFVSNICEILIRIVYYDYIFDFNIVTSIFLVAVIRSSVVWISTIAVRYYRILIIKEEHDKRYRKLIWLTLILKSEMYWMSKNMDKIEETMTHAYSLFDSIRKNVLPETWADRSVQVAGDVHEIKKEYELVLRGVEEITELKIQDKGMFFKDFINILEEKMLNEVRYQNLDVKLDFDVGNDFYTDKHYQLMSIFRNLIMNAFDAVKDSSGISEISFIHKDLQDQHIFMVADTGCGIDEKDLEYILSPGFSTKINYKTGQINRGLGLSLVKDIVEKDLKGQLEIESLKGKGTVFSMCIPNWILEVHK